MKKAAFALAVLILASLACQTLIPTGEPSTSQPGSQPPDNNPPPPQAQPIVPPPPQEVVLFQDDFSSTDTGWDIVNLDYKSTDYANGGFRIWVNKTQLDVWSTLNRDMGQDVVIEVDATKVAGPDVNDYGVMCRFAETSDSDGNKIYYFYFFLVSSDGKAVIAKTDNNQQTYLSQSGELEPNPAIRTGNATNSIRAECIGNRLTLIVNGQRVMSVSDLGLGMSGADVGMIAGTFDPIGVDILFDNFRVLKP